MENIENAIEIRALNKIFKVSYDKPQTLKERLLFFNKDKIEHKTILKDISLDIKKGETLALVGTNGSGKSTLLKLMTKILYPNSGKLETQGKLTSLLELGAGFHQDFTGRENIYFNASIFGLTRSEIDKRLVDIIKFSELEEFIDNPVRTYSSGMYMRLAFSIAINVDAEILLIDEILAVGDQHFQEKCFNKLRELKNSDTTIVIVSHDLNTIRDLCDRAIWIYKGEIKGDGDPTYVIEEYLNQVSLDHQEKRKVQANSDQRAKLKTENFRGLVYIDNPIDFSSVNKKDKILKMNGWEISDCLNSTIKVLVDQDEVVDLERVARPDVFVIYEDMYGGALTNDLVGWQASFDISALTVGPHSLDVCSYGTNQQIIAQKRINFNVEED
ncbi:MAG: ABC transporter ATP-binding protein [Erysipelotrichaceae bacterium]